MAENILETLQHVIQDVIAPDVRELKVRVASLEKQMDVRFAAVNEKLVAMNEKMDAQFKAFSEKTDTQFKALSEKTDAQFRALMAAIGESKAQSELNTMRLLSSLSERVAVLESHRTPRQ